MERVGGRNLTSLLKRLEAATSRLESLASFPSAFSADRITSDRSQDGSALEQHEDVNFGNTTIPHALNDYDEIFQTKLTDFVALSEQIGGVVAEQAHLVTELFHAQREFLEVATRSKKPDMTSEVFLILLSPMQKEIAGISELRERNRSSPLFNHLSVVSEGAPAMGWVTIEPAPAGYIAEMIDSSQYYGNRVLNEFKDQSAMHINWTKSFSELLQALLRFVKQNHTAGVSWNQSGVDAKEAIATTPASQANEQSSGTSAPPPPPLPPPSLETDDESTRNNSAASTSMDDVFAQINQGSDVVSGLRKVRKGDISPSTISLTQTKSVPSSGGKIPTPGQAIKHAPRKELQGNRWLVEHFENDRSIVIDNIENNHVVSIYGCSNCTIQIKGKLNAVTMNQCSKVGLLVDTLISTLDIIRCVSFELEIKSSVPTVSIDSSENGQIYLNPSSLNTQILTSKCSALNLTIPSKTEGSSMEEHALPEMLRHSVYVGNVRSEVVEPNE